MQGKHDLSVYITVCREHYYCPASLSLLSLSLFGGTNSVIGQVFNSHILISLIITSCTLAGGYHLYCRIRSVSVIPRMSIHKFYINPRLKFFMRHHGVTTQKASLWRSCGYLAFLFLIRENGKTRNPDNRICNFYGFPHLLQAVAEPFS